MSDTTQKLKQFIDNKKNLELSPNKKQQIENLEKILNNRKFMKKSASLSMKYNKDLPLVDKIGKNPETLEKYAIKEWLSENSENAVILLNNSIYLVKKTAFMIPNVRDIFMECVIENGQLMVKDTFKSKRQYFSLKYLTSENIILDLSEITKLLRKNNIIKLEERFPSEFISRETLLMSQIGISKIPVDKTLPAQEKLKQQNINKKNLPFNKDIYFENIIAQALSKYSYQWDAAINNYLRFGEPYFSTQMYLKYYRRYGKTVEESKQAVKDKITEIDRAFLEAAERNDDNTRVYWRGMVMPFANLQKAGDTQVIENYISISVSPQIAMRFSGLYAGKDCCLYRISLDKGIPIIDMQSTTKFKHEKEILLPRNLVFKYVDTTVYNTLSFKGTPVVVQNIQVSVKSAEQFKIKTGCYKFMLYKPQVVEIPKAKKEVVKNKTKKEELKDIEHEMKTNPIPNIKRCPKGSRKNKVTGKCDPYGKEQPATTNKSKTQKAPRCPNGQRRNPKTKMCEAKH
tara:strand:- start:6140 stop:7681 length:1542 start_codon:yes stop_codon:yes gene_type:complete